MNLSRRSILLQIWNFFDNVDLVTIMFKTSYNPNPIPIPIRFLFTKLFNKILFDSFSAEFLSRDTYSRSHFCEIQQFLHELLKMVQRCEYILDLDINISKIPKFTINTTQWILLSIWMWIERTERRHAVETKNGKKIVLAINRNQ